MAQNIHPIASCGNEVAEHNSMGSLWVAFESLLLLADSWLLSEASIHEGFHANDVVLVAGIQQEGKNSL